MDPVLCRKINFVCRIISFQSAALLFYEKFSRLLERVIAEIAGIILLIGHFNLHVDDANDQYAKRFANVLSAFDPKQHVRVSTHRNGHTLDLLITRSEDSGIKELTVRDPVISKHCAIHCDLKLLKQQFSKKLVNDRKLPNININCFSDDTLESPLFKQPFSDLGSLVDQYNDVLQSMLDKHAPLKTKQVIIRQSAPWYTPEIAEVKGGKGGVWKENSVILVQMQIVLCLSVL